MGEGSVKMSIEVAHSQSLQATWAKCEARRWQGATDFKLVPTVEEGQECRGLARI